MSFSLQSLKPLLVLFFFFFLILPFFFVFSLFHSFNFLAENLEKIRSTELYGAPLEGSTIFLNRSSTCRMSMESYTLAELKYAIFSRTGRETIKLPRSELFLWTVFKHGLLEGLTFLLQYNAITRTP